MKVVTLLGFFDYEGFDLIGVFASVAEAKDYALNMDRGYKNRYECYDRIGYVVSELGKRIYDVPDEVVYIPE